jgi:hypothetical protein
MGAWAYIVCIHLFCSHLWADKTYNASRVPVWLVWLVWPNAWSERGRLVIFDQRPGVANASYTAGQKPGRIWEVERFNFV